MLRVNGVTVAYQSAPVLIDVSMHADRGEVVAILGSNGAGKTTLLRAICGLLPTISGTIEVEDVAVQRMAAHRIARMGVAHVVESRGVLPGLSVEENILLGLVARHRVGARERSAIVDAAVANFPWMGDRLASLGSELSGGQQQMVALSRALALDPPLLLLDEPSLGIAPTLVDEIYDWVEQAADDSRTIVIVEQHVHKALAVADRAYVLRRGQVALQGSVEQLSAANDLERAYLS